MFVLYCTYSSSTEYTTDCKGDNRVPIPVQFLIASLAESRPSCTNLTDHPGLPLELH
jgi:hypothetical protein